MASNNTTNKWLVIIGASAVLLTVASGIVAYGRLSERVDGAVTNIGRHDAEISELRRLFLEEVRELRRDLNLKREDK